MAKSYQGVETIHIEPEDFDEVNIFNISQDWLDDLKAEFNFENKPDLDLRIFILIDQIEKMATSDGIWFVNLNQPINDTTPDEGGSEDGMVGC